MDYDADFFSFLSVYPHLLSLWISRILSFFLAFRPHAFTYIYVCVCNRPFHGRFSIPQDILSNIHKECIIFLPENSLEMIARPICTYCMCVCVCRFFYFGKKSIQRRQSEITFLFIM